MVKDYQLNEPCPPAFRESAYIFTPNEHYHVVEERERDGKMREKLKWHGFEWAKREVEYNWYKNKIKKGEREEIFLTSSMTFGEAFEARRAYLESKLKEAAADMVKFENNPLCGEDVKQKYKKAKGDYKWHLKRNESKELNIFQAKERSIKEFIRIGRGDFVSCPFHNEKSPSCHIFDKGRKFNCFGCGEKGSVVDWIMKTQGKTFIEAVKYLS